MSVATEISRIQTARNAIRSKAVELGIGTGTDDLTKLAAEIEAIENRGAVSGHRPRGRYIYHPQRLPQRQWHGVRGVRWRKL